MDSNSLALVSPELMLEIGALLPLKAIKQLRLTCQRFSEIFAKHILHSINLFKQLDQVEGHAASLRSLTHQKSAICHLTQSITIGRPQVRFCLQGEANPNLSVRQLEGLQDDMTTGLLACKNLRKLVWHTTPNDPQWLVAAVTESINRLPGLLDLKIDGSTFEEKFNVDLNFSNLSSLESISIMTIAESPEILEHLSKSIASSSSLTSINIDVAWDDSNWKIAYSLHSLFSGLSEDRPFRRLSLNGLYVRFDSQTLPHLKSLVSLKVINQMHPPDEGNGKYRDISGPSSRLWTALQDSGIYLQELEHDWISESLIEYLSSFTGLRTLRLDVQAFENQKTADAAAVEFFSRAFPKHAHTLEDLTFDPGFEGAWCFGTGFLQDIAKCGKLRRLSVRINFSGLYNLDENDEQPTSDTMTQFIDMAIAHLPHLDSATVRPANLNSQRWARCGNPAFFHAYHTSQQIVKSIRMYRAHPTVRFLPQLTVTRGLWDDETVSSFETTSAREGGSLMYVDSSSD